MAGPMVFSQHGISLDHWNRSPIWYEIETMIYTIVITSYYYSSNIFTSYLSWPRNSFPALECCTAWNISSAGVWSSYLQPNSSVTCWASRHFASGHGGGRRHGDRSETWCGMLWDDGLIDFTDVKIMENFSEINEDHLNIFYLMMITSHDEKNHSWL